MVAHLVGGRSKNQRIWDAIRGLREGFTAWDVAHRSDVEIPTVKATLKQLRRGGFIEPRPDRGCREKARYTLIRDQGVEAPRLDRNGRPSTHGMGYEQMWRTLRMCGDVNYLELASLASTEVVAVSPTEAGHYLKHLARAGYVVITTPGRGRYSATRYRAVPGRYSGPRPPMVLRTHSVYDPNVGEVVWQEDIPDDVL